jgi:hypothetical protein
MDNYKQLGELLASMEDDGDSDASELVSAIVATLTRLGSDDACDIFLDSYNA